MNRRAALGYEPDNRLLAGAWPSSLMPYLEKATTIVICPEDLDPSGGGFTGGFPVQMAISPNHTWEGITHYLDLVPGPITRKLSVQQHTDWWPTAPGPPPETYDGPEGFPVTYFLVFEDILGQGESQASIDDCQVMVELDANGVPTFYPADTPWSSYKMFFVWLADHTNALESDETLAVYPGETRSVTTIGTAASYGMNEDVAKLEGGTDKILAVDYEKIVADSDQDQWSDWHDENGVPTFARHAGKMNVLHMDGSVKLRSDRQIDPVEASVAEKYWHP
jgi:prepilin-type processing-associated H-X9-DG protein